VTAYLLKRLAFVGPLLVLVSFLAFALLRMAPGGPFDRERVPASPEIEKALRARYHLDEPLAQQYLRYLGLWWERTETGGWRRAPGGLIAGDFGPSLKYRDHSVNDILAQALPVSLTLGVLAFGLALGLGIPLGVYTAVRKGRWDGGTAGLVALLGVCIPPLVVGPVLVMVLGLKGRWFPVALWGTPWHAVLPTLTLGLYFAGRIARLMREGMLGVLPSGFIIAARAKGLRESAILWRHAFRPAVLPVVSYSGPLLADLLTGSFVVESLFQIPGIGVFLVNSALSRDYPMVVGLVVLYAVLLLGLNLAVDVAYALLDPRVRYE
jgi:oligopeptide transport system permease protein